MFAAGPVADLRRDAARQHRAWRSDRARGLSRAGRRRRRSASIRSLSLVIVVPLMALHRLRAAAARAQPHARRRSAAAAAGDLRPLGHHPERAAGAVHRRQRQAQAGAIEVASIAARRRARHRRAAADPVRARGRGDRRPAMAVLSHRARPRLPRHLGRSSRSRSSWASTTATSSRSPWRCRSPSSRSPACCSRCAPISIRRSGRRASSSASRR